MARPPKRMAMFVALMLMFAQSQSLWAVTNNFLVSETMPNQSSPFDITMVELDNTELMLECAKRCDTSAHSFNLLAFISISQPTSLKIDRRSRYLNAPYQRIAEEIIEIELPPPII